jgi:hypothetical protein
MQMFQNTQKHTKLINQIKTKTKAKNKKKKKYLHSIQKDKIRQSIFSGLGHSPGRCQAALQDSANEKN